MSSPKFKTSIKIKNPKLGYRYLKNKDIYKNKNYNNINGNKETHLITKRL